MNIVATTSCEDNYRSRFLSGLCNIIKDHHNLVYIQSDKLNKVGNKIILLDKYSDYIQLINPSNKVIYFTCDGNILNKDVMLLPYLDKIIVQDRVSAIRCRMLLSDMNFNIPVYIVPPYVSARNKESANNTNLISCGMFNNEIYRNYSVLSYDTIINSAGVVIGKCESIQPLLEVMLAYRPVIAAYDNDIILDGYNGRYYPSLKCDDNILRNAYEYASAIIDSCIYKFNDVLAGRNPIQWSLAKNSATWVVPGVELYGGKISKIPRSINRTFRSIDIDGPINIIKYFMFQKFDDVYVFNADCSAINNCDLGELRRVALQMGKRLLKIHFCIDGELGNIGDLINMLSVIPIREGTRQVAQS